MSLSPSFCHSPSPICIVGPTSVGKSGFAAAFAQQQNAELIGVDAFQLYRGLPILTAQSTSTTIAQHLIACLPLTEECDAMRYRSMALPIIQEVCSRQKIPLLVGGTGFYLRALLSPLDPLPPADMALREELSHLSHKQLLAQLSQLDAAAPSQIDIKNRRRVERTIEILLLTGKPLASIWKSKKAEAHTHRGIFLVRHRDDLHQRIETSVHLMFQHGVLDEVSSLGSLSQTASMTLGLRDIQAHLRGELSLQDTISTIIQATKRYAKRQMTWFRNQHSFPELNLSHFSSLEKALEEAHKLLSIERPLL